MTIEKIIKNLDQIFEQHNFKYGCLADPDIGVIWEKGCADDLDGSDLPRALFGDKESINNNLEYLKESILPQMMGQGDTRSVMGLIEYEDKNYPYALFLDSTEPVIEYYKFAKKIDNSVKLTPTEEEFARASTALEKRSRGLDQIRENMLCNHAQEFNLHEFFILDSSETSFRAYVFFKKETDKKNAYSSGLTDDIEQYVYDQLKSAERGSKKNLDVTFEFDSHENVEKNFEGDYYSRLR